MGLGGRRNPSPGSIPGLADHTTAPFPGFRRPERPQERGTVASRRSGPRVSPWAGFRRPSGPNTQDGTGHDGAGDPPKSVTVSDFPLVRHPSPVGCVASKHPSSGAGASKRRTLMDYDRTCSAGLTSGRISSSRDVSTSGIGTRKMLPHLGQRTRRLTFSGGTDKVRPHSQCTVMYIVVIVLPQSLICRPSRQVDQSTQSSAGSPVH